MAKNRKIELSEPIYEMQEKETPKQFWFANEYFHFDGTIDEFLDYWYPEDNKGNLLSPPQRAPSGEKNPFTKLPAKATMKNWSRFKQWYPRKKAYWADFIKDIQDNLKKDIGEFFKEDSKELIKSLKNDWKLDVKIDNARKINPHMKARGKSDLSKAHNMKLESLLTEAGMPKDFTKNDSTVKVDAEIKSKKENYLFVNELSDYNLDDALNEVTENVDRKQGSDN
ncbi:MAG: hypothetical protein J6P09_05640 [Methanobrevibacter sp.]|nr:hypothetical protein [Methanobrevibacter sp.]MBO6274250.1 hypothetical protein [Methanobrevibacter sp.]